MKYRWENSYKELSAGIGDFALCFERLCRHLRLGIFAVLEVNGLKDAWSLSEILVGDLTANPLQSILRALIAQTRKCNENESLVLKNIFKRIVSIVEKRNNFLHSDWYIDYISRNDLQPDVYMKYRPGYNKSGKKPASTKHTLKELKQARNECLALSEFVECLESCVLNNRSFEDYLHMVDRQASFIDPANKCSYREET